MTETNNAAAEPASGRDPARPSPGEYLRKLREEKGHTHAAVGTALHLTVHYIKALEGDEYGKLPGLTFVKGYLRAYARFLGGDVDRVLALFDEHIAGLLDAGMHTARVERSRRRQDQALRWGIGAGFVVVAGLAAGWWFMSGQQEPAEPTARAMPAQPNAAVVTPPRPAATAPRTTAAPVATVTQPTTLAATTAVPALNPLPMTGTAPQPQAGVVAAGTDAALNPSTASTAAPATGTQVPDGAAGAQPADTATTATLPGAAPEAEAPAASTTATVTPAANGARQVSLVGAGDDELRVTFSGNSWIEVDDGSLVRLYQDMLAAGDTLTIRGEAPFHVLLGDAANVEVSLNAAAVDISADIRDDSTARLVLGVPAAVPNAAEVPL